MIDVVQRQPKKKGGLLGAIGDAVGGLAQVAGVVAAPFTAGASLGLGGAIGGAAKTIGNLADPGSVKQGGNITPLQSKAEDPGVQLANLNEFDDNLKKSGLPEDDYNIIKQHSDLAKQALMNRLGRA
jgi:hypothetical protein